MKPLNLGGQAVMEGVMIQSPTTVCMAVRRKDESITLDKVPASSFSKRHAWARWPIVRGVVNLFTQLKTGYKMLLKSADYLALDETGQAEEGLGILGTLSMVLAVVLAMGMFVVLPNLLVRWLLPNVGGWRYLLEGCARMLILAGYLAVVSMMKEMRRIYMYHGAEHRVLHCYEHGVEPTAENSKRFPVVHPRCGTSYLFLVVFVSVLTFAVLGHGAGLWAGIAIRLISMPLVAGLAYELLRFAAKHENFLTKALRAPGLLLQRLTTRVPDDAMIEVAAAAYEEAMKDVV